MIGDTLQTWRTRTRPAIRRSVVAALLVLSAAAGAARAFAPALPSEPSGMCDAAAAQASRETGVPLDVLLAITRTETGRRRDGQLRPWPWTVNMEGKGDWFETREAAIDYARASHGQGARSFDVGCFQLNYRWHGAAFRSIEEMFDPLAGARYAAAFLSDLHVELGDWSRAAGAYHSRTPQFAERYRTRFDAIRAAIPDRPEVPAANSGTPFAAAPARADRVNTYPLLQSPGVPMALGSLVPLDRGGGRSLFDPGTGG